MIGTGCYEENHIKRVFVAPALQGKGCGTSLMRHLENEIYQNHASIFLEASLPACRFYEKMGYITVRHNKIQVENRAVLVYDIMQKNR